MITSVLLDCFLFLSYYAICYYVSFLIQLTEIIKKLSSLYILLHSQSVVSKLGSTLCHVNNIT